MPAQFAKFSSSIEDLLNRKRTSVLPPTQSFPQPVSGSPKLVPTAKELLSEYLQELRTTSASKSTVKNYASDLSQFIEFSKDSNIQTLLSEPSFKAFFVDQQRKGLKHSSIHRKIVSLKLFSAWVEKNYLGKHEIKNLPQAQIELPTVAAVIQEQPTGLHQDVKQLSIEQTASAPAPKQAHKPQQQPSIITTPKKKFSFADWILGPYFHLATLIIFFIFISILWYRQFFITVAPQLAYPSTPVSPDRILSFQARLTDVAGSPITTATNTTFKLYDAVTAGNLLWNSGTCSIDPDQDGIFSTILGSTCGSAIDPTVFTENSQVWLEITVISDVLTPRQRIATIPFALNSETIQGFPVNSTASATRSTVLVMNQWGEVLLGEQSPKLQSVSGTFTISGSTLNLVTNSGSNGDITLNPDGTGTINLTGNVLNDGYLFTHGATISATYASSTPLTINGTSGQVLTVDNSGNIVTSGGVTTSGNIAVNGGSITSTTDITINPAGGNVLFTDGTVLNIGGAAASAYNFLADSTAGNTTAAGDNDLYIQDVLEVDGAAKFDSSVTLSTLNTAGGVVYTNGSGQLLTSSAGSTGDCLQSGGTGSPTWGSCSSGGLAGTWRIANGAQSPVNDTLDFLIGNAATTSAKFAVINVNSGTPTATLSAGAAGGSYLTADGTLQTTANQSLTVGGNTTGNIAFNPLNGSGTSTFTGGLTQSGGIVNLNVSSNNAVNIASGNSTGTVTIGGTGTQTLDIGNGAGAKTVNLGSSNSTSTTAINAGSGGLSLNSTGSNLAFSTTTSGNITATPALATGLFNVLTGNFKVGSGTPTVALNGEDAYITGTLEADGAVQFDNASITFSTFINNGGLLYTNGSGALAQTAVGNAGECLTSSGGGAPTWGSCGTGGLSGTWRITTGTISPVNDTVDLLVGSTATASAKFAIINVNSGTPTATLSAGAAGGAYLNATGSLQTTANQTLALGGDTTGDIEVSPLNGAGGVNVNLGASRLLNILTGNLKVGNGTPDVTQNGEDAYIEGTLEVDGAVRFDNSTITLSSFTNNGGIFYSNGSGVLAQSAVGNSGECLKSNGGGAPTFGPCTAGDLWRVTNGGISPVNDTLDLLIGNTATSSAKFAVINVNSGTPTATLSAGAAGGAYLNATGSLQTTANQTLTLGGDTTGDLALLPQNGAGSITATIGANNLFNILTGNLKVGSGTPTNTLNGNDLYVTDGLEVDGATRLDGAVTLSNSTITLSAFTNNGGLLFTNGSGVLAQTTVGNANECLKSNGGGAPTFGPCVAGDLWRVTNGGISPVNDTLDLLIGNTATTSAKFAVINVNSGTPTATLSAGAAGGAYLTATGSLQTTANQSLTVGGATTGDITFNPLNGSGTSTFNGGLTQSGGIVNLNVSSNNAVNIGSGTSTGTVTIGGSGAQTLDLGNGAGAKTVNLGSSNTTSTTAINAGSGGLSLTSTGSNLALSTATSGDITATPALATGLFNVLTGNFKVGNGTPTVAQDGEDAYVEGTLEVDGAVRFDNSSITMSSFINNGGIVYTNASGVLAQTAVGANGECLQSIGGGTPVWGTCGSSTNYWRLANGAVSTVNDTIDLLIGSNATSSAKFAVINVNSGTPTATLSAGAAGGAYLTATGTLQTTANQALTIGGNTSGDITFNPLNGSGSITANVGASNSFNVLTGNLKIGSGTPTVSLNGEDAYITGTLETDGAVRFDSTVTVSALNTAGGVIYADGTGQFSVSSSGSTGDCLHSGGTGTPTWGSCGSGGLAGTWRIANGAHSAVNDTLDLLVGSNATASAKFAVINVNSGTPTATLSAGTAGGSYLTADGSLQTTANQTLTLGGSTTGDIEVSPLNGAGGVNVNLGSSRLLNILTGNFKVGNGTPTVAQDGEDAYVEGTLEVDGAVRFDNSTITLSSFTNNGGLLYTNGSGVLAQTTVGNANECLKSNGGGAPTFGPCVSGDLWRVTNGGISPVNDTLDLLIGNTATTSAKFAVINVNSGTPTATLSAGAAGGAYLTATGSLQTTANQALTVGGDTTGNIAFNPLNGSGTSTFTGGLTQSGGIVNLNVSSNNAVNIASGNSTGTVTIGGTGTQTLDIGNGAGAKTVNLGSSNSTSTTAINAGSGGLSLNSTGSNIALSTATSGDITATPALATGLFNVLTGNFKVGNGTPTVAQDGEDAYVEGTLEVDGAVRFDNSTITLSSFTNNGGLLYTNGSGVLAQTAAGTAGQCLQGGATPSFVDCTSIGSYWRLSSGAISPINDTVDFLIGNTATSSAKFAVINVNSGTPTATLSAGAAGGAYLTATGSLQTTANQSLTVGGATTGDITFNPLNGSGTSTFNGGLTQSGGIVNLNVSSNNAVNIASGNSTGTVTIGGTGTQTLDIGNGAGAKTVNLGSSNTTSTTAINAGSGGLSLTATGSNLALTTATSGDITATPALATGLFNVLTGNFKVGNGTPTVAQNGEDAYIEGSFEVDGATRLDGAVTLTNSSITMSTFTNNGGLLYTNGSGVLAQTAAGTAGQCLQGGATPSFVDCTSISSYWRLSSGAISPVNDTIDFLVGNTATSSAKFAVINVNSGTPTATLSAGAAGGAYLTATGSLQTTANQSLTVGGSTTGNIAFNPLNGSGTSTFNGGLTQSGGIVNLNVSSNNAVNIGSGSSTGTVTIGGSGAQTLDIGNGAGAKTVNLGSSNTTSTTAINAGSGGLSLTSTGSNLALTTATSGDITATPALATGLFNVLTGNFKVGNGTPTVAQDGEDAYVEGTLEVDGAVRFDNSSITMSTFINNGGLLYTNGSGVLAQTTVGNAGECLTSNGGGAPTWASCSASSGNFWRLSAGAISPVNDTIDFLVGNTATSSAKFAVINVNSGTPTATLSAGAAGGAYLTATGSLQTTANQSLTVGGSTTGNIAFNPLNGSGTSTFTGGLTQSGGIVNLNVSSNNAVNIGSGSSTGTVTIGGTGTQTLDIGNGAGAKTVNLGSTNTTSTTAIRSGSGGLSLQSTASNLALSTATSGDITATPALATGLFNVLTGNFKVGNGTPTVAQDGEDAYVEGTLEVDGAVRFDNSTITLSSFTNNGGVLYTDASGVLAQTTVGNSGECLKSIGGGIPVWGTCATDNYWRLSSGTISPVNDTLDFLVGNTATSSAKFAVINVNSGTPTATLSAGAAGGAYLTATGSLQTTANQSLTVGGSTTGNIAFNPLNGSGTSTFTGGLTQSGGIVNLNVSSNNAINIGSGTSTGTVTIGGSGAQTLDIGNGAGAKTVNLGSSNTTSTTTILSGSGGVLINNSNNQPVSIGSGTSTGTVTIGGSGTQTLDIGNGAGVKTVNLGSNNTTSSTAILAGTGGLSLNSTSSDIALQTNTSGNITATTGAAGGLFNVLTGSLKVGNGAPNNALTGGEAAYIEGGLEVDGAIRFDASAGNISMTQFTNNGGLLYTNASGVLAQTAVGNSGECLTSIGGGTPVWASCSASAGNLWRVNAGTLSPVNDTLDFLIGNTATSSAKFAVINVNSGTPTATLSAGAAGGAYLTATGSLQTTANQSLTVGGSTTGNIAFNPLNGSGTSTFTGGLTQSGGIVNLNVSSNNAVNIGSGTSTGTVTIGGSGAQTLDIGNGAGAKTVNLGSSNTTSTTTILSGSGGVLINNSNNQPVSIGSGTSTGTVTIGGSGAQTLDLGNGAGAKTVNLGSTNTTSTTAIRSGSGGLSLQSTASNLALSTATSGDITATPALATGLFNVLTGNFKVGSGSPTNSLNGDDAYITGTLEADGATLLDGAVTLSNSSITLSSFTTAGGLLYTNGSGTLTQTATGNSGECLKSAGGTAPTWGTCATDNYWRIASGAISPVNDTLDFLVGNTATTSAKFAVINVNSGTPTATLSAGAAGGAYLNATGTIQTTANQTLTLGGNTTGNISLLPLNGQGGVTVTSSLASVARSTDLMTLTQANDATRDSTEQLLQLTNSDTGSTASLLDIAQSGVGGTGITFTSDATGTLIDMTPTTLTSGKGIDILASGLTSGSAINMSSTTSGAGLSAFTGKVINVALGRTYTGNGTVTDTGNFLNLSRTGTQNIGTGTYAMTGDLATLSSTCSVSGGACTDSSHILTLAQNYASATGSVLDVTNAGTGVGIKLTSSSSGDLLELDASGNATTANGILIQQTAAGTITDAIDVSDETITNALNVGANTITGAGYLITSTASGLTLNSTSANLALQTTTSGDITATTGAASGLFNILTGNLKVGSGTPTVTLNGEDAYITGTLEADGAVRFDNASITMSTFTNNGGVLYTNASGVLAQTAVGNSGECLKSIGGGTPAWGTCSTASSNWRITNGAISPINDTLDLLVGNTATTSAKFAVINVNSGTPTATLSAGTAGGAYLNATGSLQTTAYQNLTLGGATTGNITLSPKSGSGSITLDESGITTTNGVTLSANSLTTGAAFIIPHTTSVIANGGSLARLSSSSVDTSTTTGVLLDLASTGSTAGTQFLQTYSALTTGLGQSMVGNALTTGSLFSGTSTSTALTTGKLMKLDWSPSGSTEIFASSGSSLLNLNVGQYGNIDKILNISDNGSTVFSVGQTKITSALPHEFTAAGDVSVAYDLQFTNQTSSYVKSNAPLYIQAGESFENNDLFLSTFGTGQITLDGSFNAGAVTDAATVTGTSTRTVSTRGSSYYLSADSTTTNSSFTTTFNVTGAPDTDGTILFVSTRAIKGATAGTVQHTVTVQINSTQVSQVQTASGTAASTVIENYVIMRGNGTWRILGTPGTADSADYAEYYKVNSLLNSGSIVSLSPTDSTTVIEATAADDSRTIGVISTNPAINVGDEWENEQKAPIALAGRVPVLINPNSADIKIGDPITASDIPGLGIKATKPGFIVGRAMEDWTSTSGTDRIMVFVNPVFYDPGYLVNQFGQLENRTSALEAKLINNATILDQISTPAYDTNDQPTNTFSIAQVGGFFKVISNTTGETVNHLIAGSRAVFGQIESGLIKTKSLVADQVTVNQKLTSPVVETNSLKSSLISPLANEDLTLKLGDNGTSNLVVTNASDEAVLIVDQQGNTDIAGTLTTNNLEVTQDATLSGQLTVNTGRFAQLEAQKATLSNLDIQSATISGQLFLADGRSIQGVIDDNAQYLASVSAQTEAITQQIQSAPEAVSASSFDQFLAQLTGSQDASVSAAIAALSANQNITLQSTDMVLAPDAVFVKEYLNVTGYTQLSSADISTSLTVGSNLLLTNDSIASANGTLFIQPTANNPINLMAGLLVLNPDGNAVVNGDLIVNGDVKVSQKLSTNAITPNDFSSDFTLKLATESAVLGASTQSKFSILDASNSAVASIDASGSARFNNLATSGITIQQPIATATDSASIAAIEKNQTAGSKVLTAGTTEMTIDNNNVADNVLIYLTPTSDTANQVLFLKAKETCSGSFVPTDCQKSFTIGIKNAVTQDISFNYWIVKVE